VACDPGPADLARAGSAADEPSRFVAFGGIGTGTGGQLPDSVTRPATRAELQVWRT
jgi:O-acetyl-ADP-ribose deacetylase (regulator of RNase III)